MTTAEDLLAEDGSVRVPQALAASVHTAVLLFLSARATANGGALTPEARALLHALHRAASSASATPTAAPATVNTSRVLGVAEAADVLGCNRQYVRRLCLAGRIPATRITGGWVIEAAALDDYRHGRAPNGEEHEAEDGEAQGVVAAQGAAEDARTRTA
ncbi:helix-turn-helix domain-containing protein [Streptomyces sp. NPDC056568]|uniref:helix-turn-helix domain-containing protein n=1 Tax=Streptomyces sp. NPDC056568 TaxID=3345866 RepID=UPI0036C1A1D8